MRRPQHDFKRIITRSPMDKHVKALLLDLLDQGVRMKRTKNGLVIYGTEGRTAGTHMTPSDHRTYSNLVAALRRAGINPTKEN